MAWAVMSCESQYTNRTDFVSTELDAEKRLALQEEKQELEHRLLEAPKLRDRLEELKAVKTERERARAL
jgi:ATP-binding cassette subfamily D (ALD) long-chain fatty acid import protein